MMNHALSSLAERGNEIWRLSRLQKEEEEERGSPDQLPLTSYFLELRGAFSFVENGNKKVLYQYFFITDSLVPFSFRARSDGFFACQLNSSKKWKK